MPAHMSCTRAHVRAHFSLLCSLCGPTFQMARTISACPLAGIHYNNYIKRAFAFKCVHSARNVRPHDTAHAVRRPLTLIVLPSHASVTSQSASRCSSDVSTPVRFVGWLFQRKQYCWSMLLWNLQTGRGCVTGGGGGEQKTPVLDDGRS